tara:strand:- start:1677 stop:3491 length:1815 start_codon:yes stop_codon:yes gene_type:complete
MLGQQNTLDFNQHSATPLPALVPSTQKMVDALKRNNQDFEWFPTTKAQIKTITDDIKALQERYFIGSRSYHGEFSFLDIGAGDGRVLKAVREACKTEHRDVSLFAIEKADIHTRTYRGHNISLIGTDFEQCNFISKNSDIAFTNPPYSTFSTWVSTLIRQLNFSVLYAIIPTRWKEDKAIKEAMKDRGLKYASVLDASDFYNAERQARAHVELIRFSFTDLDDTSRFERHGREYKPHISKDVTDPFQQFLDEELGLRKTHSATTNEFNVYAEQQRIQAEMAKEGTPSYELVQSRGVLHALLENYEIDLQRTLAQYKKISELDGKLLAELGVEYEALRKGVKEKLFGFRNVYWSLLFTNLDAISSRLISKYRDELLNKLKANNLDFTYNNAVYVISYAVDYANELIDKSLVSVYCDLTSEDSIKRYYVSNERVFTDNWRYNCSETKKAKRESKRILDYRFIYSSYSNFSTYDWERGLNEGAFRFLEDMKVVGTLMGYSNIRTDIGPKDVQPGGKVIVTGNNPDGKCVELLKIRFYKNGNRHLSFDKAFMLSINVTVSRLLGWCRNKEEFAQETESKDVPSDKVWSLSDTMKVSTKQILALTSKAA